MEDFGVFYGGIWSFLRKNLEFSMEAFGFFMEEFGFFYGVIWSFSRIFFQVFRRFFRFFMEQFSLFYGSIFFLSWKIFRHCVLVCQILCNFAPNLM